MAAVKQRGGTQNVRASGKERLASPTKGSGSGHLPSISGSKMHFYELRKGDVSKMVREAISEDTPLILMPDGDSVKVVAAGALMEQSGRIDGLRTALQQFLNSIGVSDGAIGRPKARPNVELSAEAKAKLIGKEIAREDLEKAGGGYTLEDVVKLLGISRQAIANRRKAGILLAVSLGGRNLVYPAFQFDADGDIVSGIDDVVNTLGYSSPWSVLNFLVERHDDCGGATAMDLLKAGDKDAVLRLAKQHAALDSVIDEHPDSDAPRSKRFQRANA